LHDGGVALEISASPNGAKPLCNSTATYAGTPEYIYQMKDMKGKMGPDEVAKDHISYMPGCEPEKFQVKEMKRNQNWQVNGYYDYNQRKGNLESGKQGEIMAIGLLLVAVEPGTGMYFDLATGIFPTQTNHNPASKPIL
jgi:hypothetical protein